MSKSEDLHLNGKIPYSYRKMDHSSELPDNFDEQNDDAKELISWKMTKETKLNDIYENIIIISKLEKSGSVESAKL